MTISRKITLLLPTFKNDNDNLKHLYFILTDPCFDYEQNRPEMLLLVNCSSIKEGRVYDDTCILTAGEHPFIVKDSFIFYQEMRIESLFNIEKGLEEKRFTKKEIINDELYFKILDGVFKSRQTKRQYIRFIKGAIKQKACLDIFSTTTK